MSAHSNWYGQNSTNNLTCVLYLWWSWRLSSPKHGTLNMAWWPQSCCIFRYLCFVFIYHVYVTSRWIWSTSTRCESFWRRVCLLVYWEITAEESQNTLGSMWVYLHLNKEFNEYWHGVAICDPISINISLFYMLWGNFFLSMKRINR